MSTFRATTQHSHAAPFIRERLAQTLVQREAASLKRDRREYAAMASGIRQALSILMSSDDYQAEPGIAQVEDLPPRALDLLIEFLDSQYERLIGEPAPEPTSPVQEVRNEGLRAVADPRPSEPEASA